eukprot:CAMPEP_0114335888 /NCGR_PEP_ID=MMETSP0101-20121206/5347_1 /TAXON_ID=38822 ORGANISM="Pteridomonas danica, Strain PT" /NCGR_SAMPLE_ID=MMETSP0101 /ASSEMBLY_ACC=CAM_ASM_000211 /LENGTH=447 /DNA_ID=CAMNT_0001467641 /DNA_START=32 /DNA_END=1375 /DNA_ORIENTATION=+
MVMGTYWATFRDWGGRKPHRNEIEKPPSGAAKPASVGTRRSLLEESEGQESSPIRSKTLWSLLAPHAILATIDEYFSHDWGKVMVAPYLAHADISDSSMMQGIGSKDKGFKATHSSSGVDYKDGRTIQLFFRGGVDHGSMCKRRRIDQTSPQESPLPPAQTSVGRKRNASEIAAFANKAGDSSVTWLREAAVDFFRDPPPGVAFVATGDRRVVFQRRLLSSSPPSSYARLDYVAQLMKSRFCLHLQGDTTTSRRLFDSIAAGCIPVIIADNVNLPFSDKIDWSLFTIIVPESEVLRGKSYTLDSIMQRKHHPEEIAEFQYQLSLAKHELLYGIGDPLLTQYFNLYDTMTSTTPTTEGGSSLSDGVLEIDNSQQSELAFKTHRQKTRRPKDHGVNHRVKAGTTPPLFKSRVVDHILQEAFEQTAQPGMKYRRFKPAFSKCLDLTVASN